MGLMPFLLNPACPKLGPLFSSSFTDSLSLTSTVAKAHFQGWKKPENYVTFTNALACGQMNAEHDICRKGLLWEKVAGLLVFLICY